MAQNLTGTAATTSLPIGRIPQFRGDAGLSERARRMVVLQTAAFASTLTFAVFFLVTGLLGVWAAYDGGTALFTYLQLVLGLVPLFVLPLVATNATPIGAETKLSRLAIGTLYVMGLLVAIAQLAAPLLTQIGMAETGPGQMILPLLQVLPSVDTLASIAVLLTLPALAAFVLALRRRKWFRAILALVGLMFAGGILFASSSMATVVGLVVAFLVSLYLSWRLGLHRAGILARILDLLLVIALIGALLIYLYGVFVVPVQDLARLPLVGETILSRVNLWRDALPVGQDYWYSGAGLGVLPMVLSTYAFLVHVPLQLHVHNLYLQILLEQGAFGLLAYAGMLVSAVVAAICASRTVGSSSRILLIGWLGAVLATSVQGLFDSELYASNLRFVQVLPIALLAYLSWLMAHHGHRAGVRANKAKALGSILAALIMLLSLGIRFPTLSWHANLGAVLETKPLLGLYTQGGWMIQDNLLRERPDLFVAAEEEFRQTLLIAPENATANRRLGQIAFARGDYEAADRYLNTALASRLESRMTLQYLGELYALGGNPQQAALIWQMKENGEGQLQARSWWYQYVVTDKTLANRFDAALAAYRMNVDMQAEVDE